MTSGCALASAALALVTVTFAPPALADQADVCADNAERAQNLRDAGKLQAARQALRTCAQESCPAVVRTDCERWLVQVDAQVPSIVVRAVDARGRDVEGAGISIDGLLLSKRIDGSPHDVDPGPHRLRVVAASGAAAETAVVIASGERSRVAVVRLGADLKMDGTADQGDAAPLSPEPGKRTRTAPWILGGVAVASLAAAAAFEATGASDWQSMKSGCAVTGSCSTSAVDWDKARLWVLAPATFAVGAISGGLAAWLALRRESSPAASGAALVLSAFGKGAEF